MMQRISLLFVLLAFACTDDGTPPAVGGRAELAFAGTSGSNVDPSPLPPTDIGVVFADAASHTRVIGVFAFEPESDGFRRKAWQLALSIAGDPVAGATYAIGTTASLAYEQLPTPGSSLGWRATGGTITVESVSGTSVTFSFSSIPMAPTGDPATGTYSFSGTITVDTIDP